MRICACVLWIVASALILGDDAFCFGETLSVDARDCVQVRYVNGLWMDHRGKRVAYLVMSPLIEQNRNEYQLYIRELTDNRPRSTGRLLIAGNLISDVSWLGDDTHLALIVCIAQTKELVVINVDTGVIEPVVSKAAGIASYSIDAAGDKVAYNLSDGQKEKKHQVDDERLATGYRVGDDESTLGGGTVGSIYILHRVPGGKWSSPQPITIQNPFTHSRTKTIAEAAYLSLSPSGRWLVFNYWADGIPEAWKDKDRSLSWSPVVAVYDLQAGTTTLGINAIPHGSQPIWSSDGQCFLLNASPPFGSPWEEEDIHDHLHSPANADLFQVNAVSGKVIEVLRNVPDHHEGALFWQPNGDVIVHEAGTAIARLHWSNGAWRDVAKIVLPREEEDRFRFLGSNGKIVVGVHEAVSTPQDIFIFRQGDDRIHLLTNLNLELERKRFAPVKTIHWSTPGGLELSGLLFFPPGYVPGTTYPLVIQTKGDRGWFTCDSGFNHDPSFAPQPIANAGMFYLIRTTDEAWNFQEEIEKRPKGYPGNISEPVQMMDMWDSAVDALVKEGMVDPSKVGIIGFSRTGFYVEFILAHSHLQYAAATAADNIQYSLGEYWLYPSFSSEVEQMYGGPPSGESFENWRKYSISFNLDKVHTPLLMEVMGFGKRDDVQGVSPIALTARSEVKNGLIGLGKPVEMYYYPDEQHQPEHPKARLASLQRNVDWYKFWLQGHEDEDPSKKEQYERWRALRKLHEQDVKSER